MQDVDAAAGRSFGYLLRDTSRMLLRLLQVKIDAHGVTLSQYFILRELWEDDGLTMSELAARVRIVDPSIATSIDSLEARGLVARVKSDEDRRRVHVFVTAKGQSLRTKLLQYAVDVNEAALRGVRAVEVGRVKAILKKVKDNLSDSR